MERTASGRQGAQEHPEAGCRGLARARRCAASAARQPGRGLRRWVVSRPSGRRRGLRDRLLRAHAREPFGRVRCRGLRQRDGRAEVGQDLLDDGPVVDGRQQAQPPAAVGARQNVKRENSAVQVSRAGAGVAPLRPACASSACRAGLPAQFGPSHQAGVREDRGCERSHRPAGADRAAGARRPLRRRSVQVATKTGYAPSVCQEYPAAGRR